MRILTRIIAALLVLVLMLGALVGCSRNKPLFYLKRVLEKTVEESVGGRLFDFLLSAMNGGSIEVTFGGTDLADVFVDSAKLKLWLGVEDSELAAEGEVVINGKTYGGEAYLTDDELVVKSPAFFGSQTLGLSFDTLESDLKHSIFSNNSGTAFSKAEISESTAGALEDIKDGLFSLLSSTDEWLELSDEILEVFLKELTEQAENNRYRERGHYYISLKVDNDSLSRTLRATREKLVEDRDFRREMRKLAATKDAIESARTGVISNDHRDDLEYFLTSSSDIDELCLMIDNAPAFAFSLNAKVRDAGELLKELSFSYSEEGVRLLGVDMVFAKQGEYSTLRVEQGDVTRTLRYCVNKDYILAYNTDFTYEKSVGEDTVLSLAGELNVDRAKHTFTLCYEVGDSEYCLAGSYRFSATAFRLAIERVEVDGEHRTFDLAIEIKRFDKMPKPPEYVNLATIKATTYAPIDERIRATLAELKAAKQASNVTPHSALCDLMTALGLGEEAPPEKQEGENGATDVWWKKLFRLP